MALTGQQVKQLCDALLSAFDMPRLRRMVRCELDQKLEQIAGGDDANDVVFALVSWAEAEGRDLELIQVACQMKPGNAELQAIAQQFLQPAQQEHSAASPRPRFPEPCEFDLTGLMEDALPHLYGKQGLVGFVIPCMEETFRVRFCERLKKELGRKNIKIRQPLQIDPFVSIDQVVSRIHQYERDLLRDHDVVCPMPISIFEPNSTIPDELWGRLSEIFKQTTAKRRLILFMYGRENAVFPRGLRRIRSPEFEAVHVFRWVVRMAEAMDWQEHIWEQWQEHMMECCCSGNSAGPLDVRLAYEHLDVSMSLLQRQLSPEQFIQELKSGF